MAPFQSQHRQAIGTNFPGAIFYPPPGLSLPDGVCPPPGLEGPWADLQTQPMKIDISETWKASHGKMDSPKHAIYSSQFPMLPPGVFLPWYEAKKPVDNTRAASLPSTSASEDGDSSPDVHGIESQLSWRLQDACRRHESKSKRSCNASFCHEWVIDARKLRGSDKQIVSSCFELGSEGSFRLLIKPKVYGERKGQASFQRAKGRGSIELKCDTATGAGKLRVQIFIGDVELSAPVTHDFGEKSTVSLITEDADFNLASAVDKESSSLIIRLEGKRV